MYYFGRRVRRGLSLREFELHTTIDQRHLTYFSANVWEMIFYFFEKSWKGAFLLTILYIHICERHVIHQCAFFTVPAPFNSSGFRSLCKLAPLNLHRLLCSSTHHFPIFSASMTHFAAALSCFLATRAASSEMEFPSTGWSSFGSRSVDVNRYTPDLHTGRMSRYGTVAEETERIAPPAFITLIIQDWRPFFST